MHRTILLLVPLALMAACADEAPTDPSIDIMPSETAESASSSVLRYDGTVLITTQDLQAGLRIVIGLPDNPRDFRLCGGAEGPDSAQYQQSGIDREAVQVLARAESVNVHVYQRSTYRGVCASTPLAQGEGRLVYTDNDFFGSENPRHNSFGFSLHADVVFADGSAGTVHARNQFVVDGDGRFNQVVNFIDLQQR